MADIPEPTRHTPASTCGDCGHYLATHDGFGCAAVNCQCKQVYRNACDNFTDLTCLTAPSTETDDCWCAPWSEPVRQYEDGSIDYVVIHNREMP